MNINFIPQVQIHMFIMTQLKIFLISIFTFSLTHGYLIVYCLISKYFRMFQLPIYFVTEFYLGFIVYFYPFLRFDLWFSISILVNVPTYMCILQLLIMIHIMKYMCILQLLIMFYICQLCQFFKIFYNLIFKFCFFPHQRKSVKISKYSMIKDFFLFSSFVKAPFLAQ